MRVEFRSLQAVRGIACLLVWGIHLGTWEANFGIARPLLAPFLRFGFAGVDLFFVLSGFLIAYTQGRHAGRPSAVPHYLLRRFWRVYPVYWVAFLLAMTVGVWGFGQTYITADGSPPPWGVWLTLWPIEAMNVVIPTAWTLSYEILFYLAFVLVLVIPRRFGAVLLLGWGIVVAFGGELRATGPIATHVLSPFIWEFLLGCGIAWVIGQKWTHLGWWATGTGLVWGTVGVVLVSSKADPYGWASDEWLRVGILGPAAGLLVYGLASAELRSDFALPRWLQVIGDGSYSIYLWHLPAGSVVFNLTVWWPHTMLPHFAWLTMMTVVGVGGGMLFHLYVERPILGLVKRRVRKVNQLPAQNLKFTPICVPEVAGTRVPVRSAG